MIGELGPLEARREMGMRKYDPLKQKLRQQPKTWLVTGVAGFIGSNLLEALLKLDQRVRGLDNFTTGRNANLEEVRLQVSSGQWQRFSMIQGDVRDYESCLRASKDVDYVLHEAALGSVPRSVENPVDSHASNVTGFLNIALAARENRVCRFVYASSSSVYGDLLESPKTEAKTGKPLSPYAATKLVNELYAGVFAQCYGFESVGLRYFNVFGPRQDPGGPYAAVIPKWIAAMVGNEPVYINGDGETSRDFCYVENVVQANLLAATEPDPEAVNQVYNVAVGECTTLRQLFDTLRTHLAAYYPDAANCKPVYRPFRPGDVRHSMADISKAIRLLGYEPSHRFEHGIDAALDWYVSALNSNRAHEPALNIAN
jgi:UDP-N-acetylglucosamine/UDP-N-acetyl-alpha-D-glucosaminouronate 4-epimerase